MLRRVLGMKEKGKNKQEGSGSNVGDLSEQFQDLKVDSKDQENALEQYKREHDNLVQNALHALKKNGEPTLHMYQAARKVVNEGHFVTSHQEGEMKLRPAIDNDVARKFRESYNKRAPKAGTRRRELEKAANHLEDKIKIYQRSTLTDRAQELINLKSQLERLEELNREDNLPHAWTNNLASTYDNKEAQKNIAENLGNKIGMIIRMFNEHNIDYELVPGKQGHRGRGSSSQAHNDYKNVLPPGEGSG